MNPWFRLYSEFADDPKVQSMAECHQRRLVMLFCLRSRDVLVTLDEQEIAFALRITADELQTSKLIFIQKGFIDAEWDVINWDKRQFISDSSTSRTRTWRERNKKKQVETSQERHRDGADTDTEQIHIQTQKQKLCVPISKPIQLGERTRFHEWWGLWSRTRGTAFRDLACTTYISIVSAEKEQACMDCTTSYLASIEPHKGYRPENFLIEMARDNFAATFTPRLNGNINRNFRAEKKAAEDEQFREGMLDLARRKGLA